MILPTTLLTKDWRRAGTEAICEYFLPPSPHPPTANMGFRWGYLFFKATNFA